jgi:hypothetical protein
MLHLTFDDTLYFVVAVDLAHFGATGPFVGCQTTKTWMQHQLHAK